MALHEISQERRRPVIQRDVIRMLRHPLPIKCEDGIDRRRWRRVRWCLRHARREEPRQHLRDELRVPRRRHRIREMVVFNHHHVLGGLESQSQRGFLQLGLADAPQSVRVAAAQAENDHLVAELRSGE